MSLLDQLENPGASREAVQITLLGDAGLGKTVTACSIVDNKNAVLIRCEDGTASLDKLAKSGYSLPKLFPVISSSQDVLDQLDVLGKEKHDYGAVIIDTITKLHIMIEAETLASDPSAKSINTCLGGFGSGQSAVAEKHRQIKARCDALTRRKKMTVIFVAHAATEALDLPDQDSYMRYQLALHKKSVPHYVNDVDLVGFIQMETFTNEGKATTTHNRQLICYPVPANVSKNRFGITEALTLELGKNPLVEFIPALAPSDKKKPAKKAA